MTATIRTMCPMNCHPTLCGMLVEVEDGHLVAVRGDPDNRGFLCIRGQASREIIGNPRRLLLPLLRARRGDKLRRGSWDEALDLIARRMRAAGREAVGTWSGTGCSPITTARVSPRIWRVVSRTSTAVSGGTRR